MPHEDRPDPLALMSIDHHEGNLGLARPDNDITSTTGNRGVSLVVDLCDERDMVFEIDVEEEGDLLFGEALLWHKEAQPQRLCAGPSDRGEHLGPVIVTKRADFDRTTVAQALDSRIVRESSHEK